MKQFFIAIDQLLNVTCFWLPGGCWADETLSARAWRVREATPWLYLAIDALFFWESAHCLMSYQSELKRRQSPPEERKCPHK